MFQYQYSLDGFATAGVNVGSAISYSVAGGNGTAQLQINLSSISALQNVAFASTITFRLYGWGATSAAGNFAIGMLPGNDLAIGGTITAISTAASVEIAGRVTLASGRGVSGVRVTMTDFQGNIRTAITNPFGYYRFKEVEAGQTYIFSASHRRYWFDQPTQVQFVGEDNGDINFISSGGASNSGLILYKCESVVEKTDKQLDW